MPAPMLEEFFTVVEEVGTDGDVRVVILTGAGQGFCSGADVGSQEGRIAAGEGERTRKFLLAPMGTQHVPLAELPKPTICAVNGVAAGMGLSFTLLCDIRIAGENARFTTGFVKRGLVPGMGQTYFLTQTVGRAKALELMYTGEVIDAREAERIGLVSRVVPNNDLMKVSKELATRIAKEPPVAIGLIKRTVYRDILSDLGEALKFEDLGRNFCYRSEDHKEAVAAYLEKREPHFKGI